VVTIYEGIDLHRVQAEAPANIHAEFWLPTHAPIVGAVAALAPEKGHKYLIDAAGMVVREVPDARFVILGEGDPSLTAMPADDLLVGGEGDEKLDGDSGVGKAEFPRRGR
jgi:glycosyltransferase involved in cell wall biosynthesis